MLISFILQKYDNSLTNIRKFPLLFFSWCDMFICEVFQPKVIESGIIFIATKTHLNTSNTLSLSLSLALSLSLYC